MTSRRPLTPRVTELRLLVEGDEPFRWLAGQHVTVRPDLPDAEVSWFSIASAPDEARPNELTMAARNASELLGEVSLGDPVVIEGPFGKLTWRDAPGALLVGAGTGVAPMRAIAQGVLAGDRAGDRAATGDGRHEVVPIVLVAGNRTPSDLLWHDELVALAHDHERFTYEPVVSQPDASYAGRRGYVQEHLGEALGRLPAGARAYICGSTPMVNACLDVLGKLGMPLEVILSEADS